MSVWDILRREIDRWKCTFVTGDVKLRAEIEARLKAAGRLEQALELDQLDNL
jgi:hypothetical protein